MYGRVGGLHHAHAVNRFGKSNTHAGEREPYTQLTLEHVAEHETDTLPNRKNAQCLRHQQVSSIRIYIM